MIKNQFCDSLGENASKFWVDISDQILQFLGLTTVFLLGGFYCKLKFKEQLAYITLLIF